MVRYILLFAIVCFAGNPLVADDSPVVVKLGTLSGPVPSGWKSEKPANLLRSFQFKLASANPDHADAEVIVFPKAATDVTKNFDKWKAGFTPPDGKKPEDVTKVGQFEVSGVTVHTLDVSGTWKYRERPNDPKSKEEVRPEFRAIWYMVVTKDETTHIRLSGHQSVIEKHLPDFEKWVQSLK
jgi:hypothetical protein